MSPGSTSTLAWCECLTSVAGGRLRRAAAARTSAASWAGPGVGDPVTTGAHGAEREWTAGPVLFCFPDPGSCPSFVCQERRFTPCTYAFPTAAWRTVANRTIV